MQDLASYTPQIVVWSLFMLSGGILLTILCIPTLLSLFTSSRALSILETPNPVVVYLYAVFALASFAGSLLIWTGNALEANPSYTLCLVSASFILSNVPTMAAASFCLVLQVAATVLVVYYPRLSNILRWIANVPLVRPRF